MLMKNSDIWYSEYHVEDDVKLSLKINEILHVEQSLYQKIQIFHNETYGNVLVLDGYVQVTERDEFVYHDMITHPAMAVNPEIKRVLIIGGGDGGTAREISRYPSIEKIDMVEIDGSVVKASEKYLPTMADVYQREPRLNLMIQDGLKFVADAQANSYDLILVDSTDPAGPGEGLFTIEFYENCNRILSDNGILINQHEGAFYEGDIEEMQKAHRKLRKVFPIAKVYGFNTPTYASGYWYFGFASKRLDPVADIQEDKWNEFALKTKYYNIDLHKGAFALPNYVKDILAAV